MHALTQQLENGATATVVATESDSSRPGKPLTLTASVLRKLSRGRVAGGAVQFYLNGERSGEPIPLDANGRAIWKSPVLRVGQQRISATYTPLRNSTFLGSTSAEVRHVVAGPMVR